MKIIVEQFTEDAQVIEDELLDRTVLHGAPLRRQRKGVFIRQQQPGEITVPQAPVKAQAGREIQQRFDLCVDAVDQIVVAAAFFIKVTDDRAQLAKDAVLWKIAKDDQAGIFMVHGHRSFHDSNYIRKRRV